MNQAQLSTGDAISSAFHRSLALVEEKSCMNASCWLQLSIQYGQQMVNKPTPKGIWTPMCNWLLDFLTNRPQSVRVGNSISSSISSPQGSVPSPLLFTLLTYDCSAASASNHIIKYADETTVVGLIRNSNDLSYREEVKRLVEWCSVNSLFLNTEH